MSDVKILTIKNQTSLEEIKRLIIEGDYDVVMLEGGDGSLTTDDVLTKIESIQKRNALTGIKPIIFEYKTIITERIYSPMLIDEMNKKSGKHLGKKHKHKNNNFHN